MMASPLEQMPPAVKCAHLVLEYEAPLTQTEVIDRTRLDERTAKRALSRLEGSGLVVVERPPEDLREKRYRLADSAR